MRSWKPAEMYQNLKAHFSIQKSNIGLVMMECQSENGLKVLQERICIESRRKKAEQHHKKSTRVQKAHCQASCHHFDEHSHLQTCPIR